MKQTVLTATNVAAIMLLQFGLTIEAASAVTTISYDRAMITVRWDTHTVVYGGYDSMTVGRGITLASKSFMFPLQSDESVSAVQIFSDTENLGAFASSDLLTDEITSDDEQYLAAAATSALRTRPGFAAGYITGELQIGGGRYAGVILFPVSLNEDGSAVFNSSITIMVGSRSVQASQLVSRETILGEDNSSKGVNTPHVASSRATDFVIITDSALAPSFALLARYRNEIGFVTRIKPIEEIKSECMGRDDAEKVRDYLKDFYAQGGRYVLLGGDETVLPTRYAYNFNSDTAIDISSQQICDLYFADLTGDWDTDGDGIWGEPFDDHADLIPELMVGRLPFSQPQEVDNYVAKLISYETSPGNGDPSYLAKAFFFSSDQMRDYGTGGQHGRIAQAYPSTMQVDTVNGVEQTRGDDPNPTNVAAEQLVDIVSQGYGIVNIIAHGSNSLFSVRTSGYNNWPKSSLRTSLDSTRGDLVSKLSENGRTSLYYSLACANGAFDYNLPPFNEGAPNLAQTLLGLKDAGAVAFVANSRWGWVSTSYLLQKAFFDSLFAHPDRPAVAAMYESKAAYYYFRDLVYGQNFLGDPTMKIYTGAPAMLTLQASLKGDTLTVTVTSDRETAGTRQIILSSEGQILGQYDTDPNGRAGIVYPFGMGTTYTVTSAETGSNIARTSFTPSIALDVDDEPSGLPKSFALLQNYPNPFNPTTTIAFDVPRTSHVSLAVYNVLGQTVKVLEDGLLSAGHHVVEWDGRSGSGADAGSGVYFYKLLAGSYGDVKKMTLVR